MKKLHVIGLALVAVFALSVVAASSAAAVEYLWLVAGKSIEGTEKIASETTGELNLTDLGSAAGGTEALCSWILDGVLLPDGKDEITDVLMLGTLAELLAEDDLECTFTKAGLCEGTEALVRPIGLPWLSQIELNAAGMLVDNLTTKVAGGLGWDMTCTTIIGEVLDECLFPLVEPSLTNVARGVEGVFAEENVGSCSLSKEKKGDIHGSDITTSEKGLITVSEGGEYLWLVAGKNIEGTEKIASETSGELNLTDLGSAAGGAEVLCSFIIDLVILPGGKDEITDILMLNGELLPEDDIECTLTKAGLCEGTAALLRPVGLPWLSQIELNAAEKIIDNVTTVSPGGLGWDMTCTTIIGEVLDECLFPLVEPSLTNVARGVEGVFAEENVGSCSLSKEKKGDIHGSDITTSEKGLITVSEGGEYLWLVAGKNIEGTEKIASETSGELNLTDLGSAAGGAEVLCSFIIDLVILPGGKDEITDILMLNGELLPEDDIECTLTKAGLCEGTAALLRPVGLPWLSQIELNAAEKIIDNVTTVSPGGLGWDMTCTTIIGEVLDECLFPLVEPSLTNVARGVEGVFAEENVGSCSLSKEKKGDIQGSDITTSGAGLVTVSEG